MRLGKSVIVVAGDDIPYPTAEQADIFASTLKQWNKDLGDSGSQNSLNTAQPQRNVCSFQVHI